MVSDSAAAKRVWAGIITLTYDPNKRHPLNGSAPLARIYAKRKVGRTLNTYDRDAAVWFRRFSADQRYAWKHDTAFSHVYSHDAVSYSSKKDDAYFDEAREKCKTRNQSNSLRQYSPRVTRAGSGHPSRCGGSQKVRLTMFKIPYRRRRHLAR